MTGWDLLNDDDNALVLSKLTNPKWKPEPVKEAQLAVEI